MAVLLDGRGAQPTPGDVVYFDFSAYADDGSGGAPLASTEIEHGGTGGLCAAALQGKGARVPRGWELALLGVYHVRAPCERTCSRCFFFLGSALAPQAPFDDLQGRRKASKAHHKAHNRMLGGGSQVLRELAALGHHRSSPYTRVSRDLTRMDSCTTHSQRPQNIHSTASSIVVSNVVKTLHT
jgi:hypothetical protein